MVSQESLASQDSHQESRRKITLVSGTAIIINSIIGSGIFVSPKGVYLNSPSVGASLIIWAVSGIVSGIGATCYAELGTTIRRSGGDYVYILRCFGPLPAFVALWTFVAIVQPAAQAVMALTFANYLLQPILSTRDVPEMDLKLTALAAIWILCIINCISVKFATSVMDALTTTKLLALGMIISLGLWQLGIGKTEYLHDPLAGQVSVSGLALSVYSGLYAFAGWRALGVVVGELQNPQRNLGWAIWISLPVVSVVYLMTNLAYFIVIPPKEFTTSDAVAMAFGAHLFDWLRWVIPIFVSISTFGSLSGRIFVTSRIIENAGKEGHLPSICSFVYSRTLTPVPAIIANCALASITLAFKDIFQLINYTTFGLWLITAISVAGLIYLRWKEPELERTIKLPIVLPASFFLCCAFLVIVPAVTKPVESGIGLAIILCGVPIYYILHFIINRQQQGTD